MTRRRDDTETRRELDESPLAASPHSVLLIFIDGLGIGTRGEHNPLDAIHSSLFSIFQDESRDLPFDGSMAVTDCRLGVEGLPQSATGQTTILTGANAAALIGRHLNGYPSPRLKQLLAEKSIYKQLSERGHSVTFANAYSPEYFQKRPRYLSATTVAAESAKVKLRTLDDLAAGRAVCHDFSNYFLIGRGHMVRGCTPEVAGARLARLAKDYDFTLYEHFITDRIGHNQSLEWARHHLVSLTRFVESVLREADLSRQTVLVTSDHGNIEDVSTRTHTLNPVATLAFGPARELIASRVKSLLDITPVIVDLFSN
jgi:2,3-bisphosphoglycerate-independent phosphoglycerate mutase